MMVVVIVAVGLGVRGPRCGSTGDSNGFLPRGILIVSGLSPLVHGRFSAFSLSVPLALPLPLLAKLSTRRLCQELFP